MPSWLHKKTSMYQVVTYKYQHFDSCNTDQKVQIEKLIHLLKPYEYKILNELHCEIIFTEKGYIIFNCFESLDLVQKLRTLVKELMPKDSV